MTKSSRSSSTTSSQGPYVLDASPEAQCRGPLGGHRDDSLHHQQGYVQSTIPRGDAECLVQVGVDFTQAQSATYNKLRRFLPTMANVMELPDLDLQSVATGQNCHLGRQRPFLQETKAPCRWGPLCRFPRPQIPPGQAEVRRQTVCPLPEEEAGTSYDGRRVPLPGRLAVG